MRTDQPESPLSEDQIKENEQKELNQLFPDNTADFNEYYKILQITNIPSSTEHKDQPKNEQLTTARRHAYKLVMAFGDAKNSTKYLGKFNKFAEKNLETNMPVHDACLFSLPDRPWNVTLWQKIIARYSPSMPNDMIMRLLTFADKIEEQHKNTREDRKKKILNKLIEKKKNEFGKEYDQKNMNKKDWIASEIKTKPKRIVTAANKMFDTQARKAFGFPARGKLHSVQADQTEKSERERERKKAKQAEKAKQKQVKQWKDENPQILEDLKKSQNDQWHEELEEQYDSEHKKIKGLKRDEYINKRLKDSRRGIYKVLRQHDKRFSERTTLATLSEIAKTLTYKRLTDNPAAAQLFFKYKITEAGFNRYLSLTPQNDDKKIPPIEIKGEDIKPSHKNEKTKPSYKEFYLKNSTPKIQERPCSENSPVVVNTQTGWGRNVLNMESHALTQAFTWFVKNYPSAKKLSCHRAGPGE